MSVERTLILCIETSNNITSVAIAEAGVCVGVKHILESNKAADKLHVLTQALLEESTFTFSQLKAVALSAGPGSYTGLRIAAAAAKGFCYALDIPLIAVSTLNAMVVGVQQRYNQVDFDVFIPMIDARRMEVFTSFISKKNEIEKQFPSLIIDDSFEQYLDRHKKYLLFGNGAFKTNLHIIKYPNCTVFESFIPSAADICSIANQKFLQKDFQDIAYFEPFYSKAFYTTTVLKE